MSELITCPSCGAQTPFALQNSQEKCQHCGMSFSPDPPQKNAEGNPSAGFEYTPDPPPSYPTEPAEGSMPERPSHPDIEARLSQEESIPSQVVTVIDTGRRISRVFVIGVAVILVLCSICLLMGNFIK